MSRTFAPVRPNQKRGFTLIELLVVIAIIAILIALLVPAVQKVRAAAARAQCQNNLKQLALACLDYESTYKALPYGNAPGPGNFTTGNCNASWVFMVLPYMEQNGFYLQVRACNTFDIALAKKLIPQIMPFTRCPADGWQEDNGFLCNYVGCSGPQCNSPPPGNCNTPIFQKYCNGVNTNDPGVPATLNPLTYPGYEASWSWGDTNKTVYVRGLFVRGGAKIRLADILDGTTNTIMLGELLPEFSEFQRYTQFGWVSGNDVAQGQTIQPINWPIDPVPLPGPANYSSNCAQPAPYNCPSGAEHCMWNWHVTWGFHSKHGGGANFAFADGSVHFISENIDHQTYQYLGCRHDGQTFTMPF
jgi:prepilin-type N-terminal cleavage/methylation domain-containing protein/prepilin-type processing-associated H-X9-DG protein